MRIRLSPLVLAACAALALSACDGCKPEDDDDNDTDVTPVEDGGNTGDGSVTNRDGGGTGDGGNTTTDGSVTADGGNRDGSVVTDGGGTGDGGATDITVDNFTQRAAAAVCEAALRCCSSVDQAKVFNWIQGNNRLEDYKSRVPPKADLDPQTCPALFKEIFDILPFGSWVALAKSGDVQFNAQNAATCISALSQGSCGDEVGAALFDGACFAGNNGTASSRAAFVRTAGPGDPCKPVSDGFGALYFGTCDNTRAFCCYEDPAHPDWGCVQPNMSLVGVCKVASDMEDPCNYDPHQSLQICKTGMFCKASDGRCTADLSAPLQVGDRCFSGEPDYITLGVCQNSFCDVLDTELCAPFLPEGADCQGDDQCLSGNCINLKCGKSLFCGLGDPCVDVSNCFEAAHYCSQENAVNCAANPQGCLVGTVASCSTTSCIMENNVAACEPDPCQGLTLCTTVGVTCDNDVLVTCEANADQCKVETRTNCADTGKICRNNECVVDPCAGKTLCAAAGASCSNDILTTCALDADGCLVQTVTNCAESGKACRNNQCELVDVCAGKVTCNTPSVSCDNDTLVTCAVDADGCLAETRQNCASTAGGICRNNACMTDPCYGLTLCDPVGKTCDANDVAVECKANQDGCPVETRTDCKTTQQVCSNGVCTQSACAGKPVCAEAGVTCRNTDKVTCAMDADGCLVETVENCAANGQICLNNQCAADPCAGKTLCQTIGNTCDVNVAVSCALDADGCKVETRVNCVDQGQICRTGSCTQDPCAGKPLCDVQGATSCNQDNDLVTCTLDADLCKVENVTDCQFGCQTIGSVSSCKADPCLGVTNCTTPGTSCNAQNNAIITCAANADGCLVQTPTTCDQGWVCQEQGGTATCVDPCAEVPNRCTTAGASCTGNTLTTCAPNAIGCLVTTTTDCAASGTTCQASGSGAACVNALCPGAIPVTCNTGTFTGNTSTGTNVFTTWGGEGSSCQGILSTYFTFPVKEVLMSFSNPNRAHVKVQFTKTSASSRTFLGAVADGASACVEGMQCLIPLNHTPNPEIVEFDINTADKRYVIFDGRHNGLDPTETVDYRIDITCQQYICGNGVLDPGEECDDNNTGNSDGCNSSCTVDNGWACRTQTGEKSTCHLKECGDGFVDAPEECDDDNTGDGDGCSASCTEESGYTCFGEPSECVGGGDTCGSAITITQFGTPLTYDLESFTNDYNNYFGTCNTYATGGGGQGKDMSFKVTVPPGQMVKATGVGKNGKLPRIHISQACPDIITSCITGRDKIATWMNHASTPVLVHITVDTTWDIVGPFDLTVELIPASSLPPGDSCMNPILIGPGTYTGDTTTFDNLYGAYMGANNECKNPNMLPTLPPIFTFAQGNDVVYKIQVPASNTLKAELLAPAFYNAEIAISNGCTDIYNQCVAATFDTPGSVTTTNSSGTMLDYYIIVDGLNDSSKGAFTMKASITP